MTGLFPDSRRPPQRPGIRRPLLLAVLCFACLANGCAPQPRTVEAEPEPATFTVLPGKCRSKAMEYEARGELRQALLHWRIVQSFSPADREIAGRIAALQQQTAARAAGHFQQGVVFYRQGRAAEARREFLSALVHEQDHAGVLEYLQYKLIDPVFTTYQVRPDDTLRSIAAMTYQDAEKEFLVAAFNGPAAEAELQPGARLKLVVLDDPRLAAAGSVAGAVPQPHGGQVFEPAVREKKKPVAADEAPPVSGTEELRRQEAETRYRRGISYYLSDRIDQAIEEWEEVLRLQPDHQPAQKDLHNARKLRQTRKKF